MDTETIRAAATNQPFVLCMNDGREFRVPHPEYVVVSKRNVVVIDTETEAVIKIATFQPFADRHIA